MIRALLASLVLAASAAPLGAVAEDAHDAATVEAPALPEAKPLGFSAKAEPSQVGLGRPFVYEIEVRHDPADTFELPKPLTFGEAAVRKVESSREDRDGAAVTRFRIEASLFDRLGEASLPDLALTVKGPEGLRELRIPGAPVTVVSTSQGDELAGMHPAQELRVPSYRVLWIALGVGLAVALGVFAWRKVRAWRRRVAGAPARPAEDVALEALEALRAEALPRTGRAREHYFRLSAILRAFVEGSGGPDALERTSGELVEALRASPLAGLDVEAFASWLQRGDLVRYAGLAADPDAAVADLEEARAMVRAVAEARRAEAEREKARKAAATGAPGTDADAGARAAAGEKR